MKIRAFILILVITNCCILNSQTDTLYDEYKTYTEINEALKQPKNVYRLELSHQKINTALLDLSVFINLRYLTLSDDSLIKLPKGIEKLSNLKVLDISSNNFILLPSELANLPSLEELYLNDEKHLDLNQSFEVINKITHLKKLHLDSLPNFKLPANLKKNNTIEFLSMRYNNLENIPQDIRKFKHLKTLNLEGNLINSMNKTFLKNKEIESLSLSVSPTFDFSKSFKTLSKEKHLSYLAISNSVINAIPENIKLLKKLVSLNLQNNHLNTFPISIIQLKNLRSLNLSGNDFNTIPINFLALNKLEELDLTDDNNLNFEQTADLVRNLTSLKVLQINNYDFTFDSNSYLLFKKDKTFIELFSQNNQSKKIHLFKTLKPAALPAFNTPFNNFNAEGFGIRLGW